MTLFLVLCLALVAGTIGGIIGMGSSIILLPVLVYLHGPKAAVPIMAVAAVMANASRVMAWWREIDWRVFAAYALGGVPAAVMGARTLVSLPPRGVDLAIGLFLLAMIPGRRWLGRVLGQLALWQMGLAGAAIGYLTGVVASTGPVSVPVFLAYGLARGAFIGTEAAASLAIYVAKAITFRTLDSLPVNEVIMGLVVGAALMAGSFLARPLVLKLQPDQFRLVMDGVLLLSGGSLLVGAFTVA